MKNKRLSSCRSFFNSLSLFFILCLSFFIKYEGLVIKNTGSWYTVKLDDGQIIESKIKGNFRLKGIRSTNPVAVGDRGKSLPIREGTAFISAIEDRKNYISSVNLQIFQAESSLPRMWIRRF